MAGKITKARQRTSKAKLYSAKKGMQQFRDVLNANPNRKGGKLPRVR